MNILRKIVLSALLSGLAVGCAAGADYPDSMSRDEVGAVSESCSALLATGAQPVALGQVSGTSEALLDTSEGRCRGSLHVIRAALHGRAASSVDPGHKTADTPVPHPDAKMPAARASMSTTPDGNDPQASDPYPHPDKPDSAAAPRPEVDPSNNMLAIVWQFFEANASADDDTTDPSSSTGSKVGSHARTSQH